MTPAIEWQRLDLNNTSAADAAKPAISAICQRDPRATLEHNLDWLFENYAETKGALNIWLCRRGTEIVGYAPLTASKAKLSPSIGERSITSWRVERHRLVGCPLFEDSVRPESRDLTRELLQTVRRDLPRNGVLFVLGARADSALFDLLSGQRNDLPFLVAGYGPTYERRMVELPESFEAYLAGLSKKTRANLRRYEKKLKEAGGGKLRVDRYTGAERVDAFLNAAIPLSEKTYQWKSLGLGLQDRKSFTRELRVAAEKGWMLCYILAHEDKPIAFQVGYRFGDTYLAHDTGYDPDWGQYWPGNHLDMEIIRDQLDRFPEVKWVDFMYGDSFNKKRFSNASRVERHFYLFPRSPWGFAVFASLEMTSRLSESAGRLLDRFGAKERLRRSLWRS